MHRNTPKYIEIQKKTERTKIHLINEYNDRRLRNTATIDGEAEKYL